MLGEMIKNTGGHKKLAKVKSGDNSTHNVTTGILIYQLILLFPYQLLLLVPRKRGVLALEMKDNSWLQGYSSVFQKRDPEQG